MQPSTPIHVVWNKIPQNILQFARQCEGHNCSEQMFSLRVLDPAVALIMHQKCIAICYIHIPLPGSTPFENPNPKVNIPLGVHPWHPEKILATVCDDSMSLQHWNIVIKWQQALNELKLKLPTDDWINSSYWFDNETQQHSESPDLHQDNSGPDSESVSGVRICIRTLNPDDFQIHIGKM